MEDLFIFLNDYIPLVSLLLSIIAIGISYRTYRYTQKNDKEVLKNKIAMHQAELDSINETYFNPITSHMGFPEKMEMVAKKKALETKIKQLKQQL